MKLPIPARDITRDLREFDIWITPSLGEITETAKFREELDQVAKVFDLLGTATENFKDVQSCAPTNVASSFAAIARGQSEMERARLFRALAATLFIVTGKSDNNSKCQFPLFLRDSAKWSEIPSVRRSKRKNSSVEPKVFGKRPLPRILDSDTFMNLVAAIEDESIERRLLEQIVSFLLKDEDAMRQLWSIGHSYSGLKQLNKGYERDLLAPLVVFKIRGSVSASGGHKPEHLLRILLESWGLIGGVDFNLIDAIAEGSTEELSDVKTRAYDFILPYKAVGWDQRKDGIILIQSQFYAGDSGSVSHKNVDQTSTSRESVLKPFPAARFIEYVDGAGYFSSLNGDLRKLLAMESTHSFFQVRSAAVRLRRELQDIGFLTPLDIETALSVQSSASRDEASLALVADGYTREIVDARINQAVECHFIREDSGKLFIREERREIVRKQLILDAIAINGQAYDNPASAPRGVVFIPGYGPFFGMSLSDIALVCAKISGLFSEELKQATIFSRDIDALLQAGSVLMR